MSLKRLINPIDEDQAHRETQRRRRRRLGEPENRVYSDTTGNDFFAPETYLQSQLYDDDYLPAHGTSVNTSFASIPDGLAFDQNSLWELPTDGLIERSYTSITPTPVIYSTTGNEEHDVCRANIETPVQEEKICYGTFFNEKVQLVGDSKQLLKRTQGLKNNGERSTVTHTLRVKHSINQQILIKFPDSTDLGFLCEKLERGLRDLIKEPSVEFDAVVDLNALVDVIHRAQKRADGAIRVNLNVYGPASKSRQVGRELSNKRLFLQEPNERRQGTRYDNPHILPLDEFSGSDTEAEEDEAEEEITNQDEDSIDSPEQNEDFQETIADVFNSLKRSGELHRLGGSESLNISLYPHQEEALDFMLQRETGDIPPEYRLWKPKSVNGEQRYYHVITMAMEQELPDESGGGILADEMGMGKSLTTLVLIEKTANDARQWADEQNLQPEGLVARRSRATLVIVHSLVLINTWVNEINKHLKGNLKVFKYWGKGRKRYLDEIDDYDIVVTTYNTLQREYLQNSGKSNSPLHGYEWYRVVLDEAHMIRRQTTTFYRTVANLSAKCRWCLTGTPIQNSLSDFAALLSFTRVKPFNNSSIFRYWISIPFEKGSTKQKAIERLAMLLEGICLRRTIERINLPGRREEIRILDFSPDERKQYDNTRKAMQRLIIGQIDEYTEQKKFGMFQYFLELRSICNHGTYQSGFSWAKRMLLDEEADPICSITRTSLSRCSSCRQPLPITFRWRRPKYVEQCRHVLCEDCSPIPDDLPDDERLHCPICKFLKAPPPFLSENGARGIHTEQNNSGYWGQDGYSSKMIRLVLDVKEDLSSTKSIIFSCWIRTLELIEIYLRRANIPFARIDGNTSPSQRQKTLDEFDGGRNIPVLIMTTGTGAFGLNLQSVNRVFMVEPQWNPSVESQAVARAIRLGQEQQVLVIRYRVKDSIEENMYSQQTQKLKISKMDFKKDLVSNNSDNGVIALEQATI